MAKKANSSSLKDSSVKRKWLVASSVVIVLIIAGGLAFRHKPVATSVVPSINPLVERGGSGSIPSSNPATTGIDQGAPSGNSSRAVGPPPITPEGEFVSNHHPGNGTPTSEASTCNTTAGAICYIQFTKGSVVKKLGQETTNAGGAAIWYWDTKTAGLETGTWTITAVAILNGQTKTAEDAQSLVVE